MSFRVSALAREPFCDLCAGCCRARRAHARCVRRAGIVAAAVVEGVAAREKITALLARPGAAYVHAHYARYGCYAARMDRL